MSVSREQRDEADLLDLRETKTSAAFADTRARFTRLLEQTRIEQQAYLAGQAANPPVLDVLVISGGGDWGAFGVGVLEGWGRIPPDHPMARPRFDIVTGVSTGALIAPFAFIGDDESYRRVKDLYRNPQRDWVRSRGWLFFLPNNVSFAEIPGLERDLRETVDLEMIRRIVAASDGARMLVVNTTNLDDGSPRAFWLTSEAEEAVASGDLDRFHKILLASSGIPGAFPYREIDGAMYVDGAVTTNILFGGRLGEEDTLPAVWQGLYPGTPIPKIRYWVIFNNQLQSPPRTVRARWPDIITRSVELALRSASVTGIRQLFSMAEVSRLKRDADVEVRVIAIPSAWAPLTDGVFLKETMNELADMGERLGADPASWLDTPQLP
jgi:hypothetical protein